MNFQLFDPDELQIKSLTPKPSVPRVTISKLGRIQFNAKAGELLSPAEYIQFLFDKSTNSVAVRPTTNQDEKATYKIRAFGKHNSGLNCLAFLNYIHYDRSLGGSTHEATWDDAGKMLIFTIPDKFILKPPAGPPPVSDQQHYVREEDTDATA